MFVSKPYEQTNHKMSSANLPSRYLSDARRSGKSQPLRSLDPHPSGMLVTNFL
jgi:hypothetical protein